MTRAILLASTALLMAAPAAFAATGGPSGGQLALTRVLLSTGGVGYFEYEATVSGDVAGGAARSGRRRAEEHRRL